MKELTSIEISDVAGGNTYARDLVAAGAAGAISGGGFGITAGGFGAGPVGAIAGGIIGGGIGFLAGMVSYALH
ncbi:hypothetical protein [Rheinheimera pleomorphica]|uniref:hypothetical protein n=1 Tax=Rheinheimera pleomorphica TaxID=2703963 RepID=UPI00141DA773|nr:hypothetical protein [Rheinheimera pleomorphica]